MKYIIGWSFVIMCPFIGGAIPFLLAAQIFKSETPLMLFCLWCPIWLILFDLWFDGSKYQDIF